MIPIEIAKQTSFFLNIFKNYHCLDIMNRFPYADAKKN